MFRRLWPFEMDYGSVRPVADVQRYDKIDYVELWICG